MNEAFEPFAEVYVPILLKNTVVTIQVFAAVVDVFFSCFLMLLAPFMSISVVRQVISSSSNACIRSIIIHSLPVKCALGPVLFQKCTCAFVLRPFLWRAFLLFW